MRAAGDLQLDDASVTDAKFNQFPLPPLHFKTADARFGLQGGRLDVQELKADGQEITLDASGQVAMREPFADSVLNLKVALAPGPGEPRRREDPALGADSAAGQGRQARRAAHAERHARQTAPALTRCALFGTARID